MPTANKSSDNTTQKKKSRREQRRTIIFWVVVAIILNKSIPYLLPHGPAVPIPEHDLPHFAQVNTTNDSLRAKHGKLRKIFERVSEGDEILMKGPETVLFDNQGVMHVLTEEANLVNLTDFKDETDSIITTAKATVVADLGIGRPLGGKFAKDGTLYFADALLGLARVPFDPEKNEKPKVELVASRVNVDGKWSRILLADDVDIGPKTGHVYFSDASDIASPPMGTKNSDPLYASIQDVLRGKKTGRLLRYDPVTDKVDVLATGLWFANGIAVDKDESFLFVAETFGVRIFKYHLEGEKKGTLEAIADRLTGFPDGADCSFSTGKCYAVLPSCKTPIMAIYYLPSLVSQYLRSFIMMLPKSLSPKPNHYGGMIEIFPGDENTPAKVLRTLQDPDGSDIGMLTGVTEYGGKLYLGSLENQFVGVYDLN